MMERLGMWILFVVATALAGLGVYALVQVTRSDGEVAYCYIEMQSPGNMSPQYQLYGFRPWRPDRIIGNYLTIEEAQKHAEDMKCPLNKR